MDVNYNELKSRISKAFSQVEPPLIGKISVDNDWDAKAINADFSAYLNKTVDSSLLEKHQKSLPALTPKAFQFFLKDYLIYSLGHPNTELTEHLIYRLSSMEPNNDYWKERLILFTPRQKNVVSEFCIFLKKMLLKNEVVLHEHLDNAIRSWKSKRGNVRE